MVFADENFKHEIDASPILGYGTYSGTTYGLSIDYLYNVYGNFQVGVGGHFYKKSKLSHNYSGLTLQFDYNFSEEFKNSYYAGIGAAHHDYGTDPYARSYTSGALLFGKRFTVSEEENISYKPYVYITRHLYHETVFGVALINFSWLF